MVRLVSLAVAHGAPHYSSPTLVKSTSLSLNQFQ